jgi:hypothetical protein
MRMRKSSSLILCRQVNIQVQRWFDDSTQSRAVMLFQQLMRPPPENSGRCSQQNRFPRFKVAVFTIYQAQSSPPLTTFVKPFIQADDCLYKSIHWFSRLLFSCSNGCVIVWLPGYVFTILAMNFTHPCIGGFTLDSFRQSRHCFHCVYSSNICFFSLIALRFSLCILHLTLVLKASARVSDVYAGARGRFICQKRQHDGSCWVMLAFSNMFPNVTILQ